MTQKEKNQVSQSAALPFSLSLNHCSAGKAAGFYGSILNHSEVRLKGRSSSLNISGDWLEVNRALNPAKLWQGQCGHGTMAWPGISKPLFSA